MSDENVNVSVEDFDINDPGLDSYAPDLDPNALPEQLRPAPIDDGVHWLVVRGNTRRKGGYVYYKDIVKNAAGEIVDGKVILALTVRALNEDGTESGFLKDYYASSTPQGPKRGSSLTYILAQAKSPVRGGSSLRRIKEHAEMVLAENAEKGIKILAKTRWVRSVPVVDENNEYVLDASGFKTYSELKGQEKIVALEVAKATEEAMYFEAGEDETAEDFEFRKQNHIDTAYTRAHIWYEPKSGDERTCSAEIQSLENPALYPSA